MAQQDDQDRKDAQIQQTLEVWRKDLTVTLENGETRRKTFAERQPIWLNLWAAVDFSWEALADAGWERGFRANYAQELKRWKAPVSLPVDRPIVGEGEAAYKQANLQDYWRFTPLPDGQWRDEFDTLNALWLRKDEAGKTLFAVFDESFVLDATGLGQPAPLDDKQNQTDLQSMPQHSAAENGGGDAGRSPAAYLADMILKRLDAATPYNEAGYDGRCQFSGCRAQGMDKVWQVFHAAATDDAPKPIHLNMSLAQFQTLNADKLQFGDGAGFSGAQFGDGAGFSGAQFGDGAVFGGAQFGDGAGFSGAQFGDGAGFDDAQFGDGAWFDNAQFGDRAGFDNAQFGDGAVFGGAQFGDGAGFSGAQFGDGAGFSGAQFGDRAVFGGAQFGEWAVFGGAQFGDRAWFDDAQFGGRAVFDDAQFGEWARFSGAQFGDRARFIRAQFGDGAWFDNAQFGDRAWFKGAQFGDRAGFDNAQFGDGAEFSGAQFGDGAGFSGAQFGDRAGFSGAQFGEWAVFGGAQFGDGAEFRGADFKGNVSFEDVIWTADTHYSSSFMGARFRDVADFQTPNFSSFSIFDGADFQRKLLLSEPSNEHTPKTLFKRALNAAKGAVAKSDEADAENKIYGQLSGGYRTAKNAMEKDSDFERAQRYYRFEVQARMHKKSTTWTEKWAAGFYAIFSDYGAAIGRPFLGLFFFTLVFAALYLGLAIGVGQSKVHAPQFESGLTFVANSPHEDSWQALEFSMNNAFRPLSALATEEPREGALPEGEAAQLNLGERLLFRTSGGISVLVRFLSIIQSLLSFLLAFLFGLAVRRKFQIS